MDGMPVDKGEKELFSDSKIRQEGMKPMHTGVWTSE